MKLFYLELYFLVKERRVIERRYCNADFLQIYGGMFRGMQTASSAGVALITLTSRTVVAIVAYTVCVQNCQCDL